jgi:hypothetical protein
VYRGTFCPDTGGLLQAWDVLRRDAGWSGAVGETMLLCAILPAFLLDHSMPASAYAVTAPPFVQTFFSAGGMPYSGEARLLICNLSPRHSVYGSASGANFAPPRFPCTRHGGRSAENGAGLPSPSPYGTFSLLLHGLLSCGCAQTAFCCCPTNALPR